MKTLGFALIVATALASAAPASARTLRDLPDVYEGLYDVAVANLVRKRCDSIEGRVFKGIGVLRKLKRNAMQAGFSEAEIDAFVDSDAEKEIMIARARKEFAARGVDPDKPEDLCRYGREEIAKNSAVGELLRAK